MKLKNKIIGNVDFSKFYLIFSKYKAISYSLYYLVQIIKKSGIDIPIKGST